MKKYQHLSLKEREKIFKSLKKGLSLRKIAKKLERAPSTISREIRRFKEGFYAPGVAQIRYNRHKRGSRPLKITSNLSLYWFIYRRLKKSWSPEQISGRLHHLEKPFYVCHETIYQFIYKKSRTWYKYLAKGKKNRGKRSGRKHGSGKYVDLPLIDQRSEKANLRKEFGHWEGDTIAFYASRYENVTTLLERVSRRTLLIKNSSRKSQEVIGRIKKKLGALRRKRDCKSLALDQGSEFAPTALRKVTWKTYYCHPHSPWERGANENMNGRLRRDLPRSLDITKVTQENLDFLSWKYNRIPRKVLNYRTPEEVWKRRSLLNQNF